MYDQRQFHPRDLKSMRFREAQEVESSLVATMTDEQWQHLLSISECYTCLKLEEIIACGGVFPVWEGRGIVWFFLDGRTDRNGLLFLHRIGLRLMDDWNQQFRRLETTVLESFPQGHRWAQMLGFMSEGVMKRYDIFGQDHRLYARIR